MFPTTDYQIVFQPHLIWRATALALFLAVGAGYVAYLDHVNGEETRSWFARVVAVLAALWALGSGFRVSSEYFTFRRALASGATGLVEGTVDDFHPMPVGGHGAESFTVQGVRFSYAVSEVTGAFNTSWSHGGPIRPGRRVRIHYLQGHEGYLLSENLILELEVAK
jgi:hypothetical protein